MRPERLAQIAKHLRRYFDLHGGQLPPPGLYQRILREVELPLIEIALDATGGNQAKCADLLGIKVDTVYRYARKGRLRGTKIGNLWRFAEADVQEFIQSGRRSPPGPGAGLASSFHCS